MRKDQALDRSLSKKVRSALRKAPRLIAFLALALTFVLFQNCTQPASLEGQDANSVLADKMEFAYDAKIDQIAYMSCTGVKSNAGDSAYFSLRAGAYRDGGVKLTDNFFETYQRKTAERMADLLGRSDANKNTVLQMAVRTRANLNSVVKKNSTPEQGQEYANLLVPLGSSEINTHLVKTGFDEETGHITGKRTKYVRLGNTAGARFEGNLRFGSEESTGSNETTSRLIRDLLTAGSAVFALTYVEPTSGEDSTFVRSPSSVSSGKGIDNTRAYGTGFSLSFAKPSPAARGWMLRDPMGNLLTPPQEDPSLERKYPMNVLTSVQEVDLLDPGDTSKSGRWVCPTNLRFRIVRNVEDLADAQCALRPDPTDAANAFRVKIARHSLRHEDWYIDFQSGSTIDGGCIVPKRGINSCYGDLRYVRYNFVSNEGCDPYSNKETNSLKSQACLAWVSICYREN